jgi:hypothetical protein
LLRLVSCGKFGNVCAGRFFSGFQGAEMAAFVAVDDVFLTVLIDADYQRVELAVCVACDA